MIFIIKNAFSKQLEDLSRKFKLIPKDFENFKKTFSLYDGKNLWKWIYKFRMKNSSIPVWKSWWFRIILLAKVEENKIMPFIIYSKTEKENITLQEIIKELNKYI